MKWCEERTLIFADSPRRALWVGWIYFRFLSRAKHSRRHPRDTYFLISEGGAVREESRKDDVEGPSRVKPNKKTKTPPQDLKLFLLSKWSKVYSFKCGFLEFCIYDVWFCVWFNGEWALSIIGHISKTKYLNNNSQTKCFLESLQILAQSVLSTLLCTLNQITYTYSVWSVFFFLQIVDTLSTELETDWGVDKRFWLNTTAYRRIIVLRFICSFVYDRVHYHYSNTTLIIHEHL